ncbi:hypothetical protein M7I_4027 [Glarea lozoyensis 74030]|uniref:Uncharacterized protein n=1 Tax=Glarea lozoyensis (strain ATCC 74030 / MF5533) TaxID=1104152 RepID=H0EN27_GLAL7|nr:hypothetical protein M7I_4027 [Glarea lozoyensis 74030]
MPENPIPLSRCQTKYANRSIRTEAQKQKNLDDRAQWRADNPVANAQKIRVRAAKQVRKKANKARREAEAAAAAVGVSALDEGVSGGSASGFAMSALGQIVSTLDGAFAGPSGASNTIVPHD